MAAPPRYPLVSLPYPQWVRATGEALNREARRIDDISARASLVQRSVDMRRCIRKVHGETCSCCGAPRPKSGKLRGHANLKGATSCQSRTCPRCSRRRSAKLKHWGEQLRENIEAMQNGSAADGLDYRLRLVTLTAVHRPEEEEDHTVAALSARWEGLRAAWSAIWASVRAAVLAEDVWRQREVTRGEAMRRRKDRRGQRADGAWFVVERDPSRVARNARRAAYLGAWAAVELAGTGHVHLHVLFFGPWVELEPWGKEYPLFPGWIATGRRAYPELGDVADVRLADVSAVAEIAKYPMKGLGATASSFDWLSGDAEGRDDNGDPCLLHPVLAARWEAALLGRRVRDLYGSFRSVPEPEDDTDETEEEVPPSAPCACGAESWCPCEVSLKTWWRWCREAGVDPLAGMRAMKRRE